MRISRRTGLSVVAALILGVGLKIYAEEHRDDCDRYMAGDRTEPPEMYVKSGTRTMIAPCNLWVVRQPIWVQGWWLVAGACGLVAVVSGVGDWRRARDR